MSATRWEVRFHDMGRAILVGEVEAIDATGALNIGRQRFGTKARPKSRIFVKAIEE
jgi:hypothetical protein